MSNEWIFLVSALADILIVFIAARRGPELLIGTVILNLLMVSIFGPMLVKILGMTTNAGNVFYACAFLATHMLLERYGRKVAMRTLWIGVGFILSFSILSQLTAHLAGISASDGANMAIVSLFSFSIRITVASIVAYTFAQYINISMYEWIKTRTRGRHLWLRINGANILGQLVDSLIFFSIAFVDVPGALLMQLIFAGWLVKTAVVLLGTPFLYFDSLLSKKHG